MLEVAAAGQNVSSGTQAYAGSWDLLSDELKRLDLLIRLRLLRQAGHQQPGPLDHFKGLVLTDNEIAGLLVGLASNKADSPGATSSGPDETALMKALGQTDLSIEQRRATSLKEGIYLSLTRLSELFGLTPFEERCLIVCLAPEIDRSYEKLYAYLQDDVTRKKPAVDLVMNLLLDTISDKLQARLAFDPQSPLLKFRLLELIDDSPRATPLISRFLKLDDRVVEFLLGRNQIDVRLAVMARLSHTDSLPGSVPITEDAQAQIRKFLDNYLGDTSQPRENVVLYLYGPYGSGKRALAQAISTDLRMRLLIADVAKMTEGTLPFEEAAWLLGREALLQPAILCLERFDALFADDNGSKSRLDLLLEMARTCSWLTVLAGGRPWSPQGLLKESKFLDVHFAIPDEHTRTKLWQAASESHFQLAADVDLGTLASKFRLTGGQIQDALIMAQSRVSLRSPDSRLITSQDLDAACRAQSSERLTALARKIEPRYGWEDIVLPDDLLRQLREICQRITYKHRVMGEWGFGNRLSLGKGVNALFAGPSGTGKTMATEIIARELGLDLYKIDLSGVVSKYIGETERNLDRVFAAAEDANAILFFDEADALFGKRSEVRDSHDRYANIEISYLLQKMEEYEGLAILATNLRANLDEAFTRRLAFTIHFPFPDEASRLEIWKGIWPASMSLDAGVDLAFLAGQFRLSGGNIKNIALAAAFLAAEGNGPVTMAHLLHATRREFQKLGKPLGANELGQYAGDSEAL